MEAGKPTHPRGMCLSVSECVCVCVRACLGKLVNAMRRNDDMM